MVREGADTEEEKLSRSLNMGKSPKGEGLRGYDGFLALLYAFMELPPGSEVQGDNDDDDDAVFFKLKVEGRSSRASAGVLDQGSVRFRYFSVLF